MAAEKTSKKLENIWYHHKWWIILGAFFLFVIIYSIWSSVTTPKYDYTVAFVHSDYLLSLGQIETLENEIAKYGRDVNNDKTTNAVVYTYNFGTANTDPNSFMADTVSLQNDIQQGLSSIFIIDAPMFEKYQSSFTCFSDIDGNALDSDAVAQDSGWLWNGSDFYKKLSYAGFPEDMYVVMRTTEGTSLEGKKDISNSFAAAREVYDKIISNAQ